MVMIYKRLWVGGCAEWPFSVVKKQSFTYAVDCGKGIALLALANDCYNQVRRRSSVSCHDMRSPFCYG